MSRALPQEVADYVGEVAERVALQLERETVGVYLSGSAAVGEYRQGRSDVDVFVICAEPLALDRKLELVASLRHASLVCPARRLELVVYPERAVRAATPTAAFDLNLNTGRAMDDRIAFDPDDEPRHWFVLDRAFVREHGRALLGPPPADVFAALEREWILAALAESLAWYGGEPDAPLDDAVLGACRAWHYAEAGTLTTKEPAGEWARGRSGEDALIEAALARRRGASAELDRTAVDAFATRIAAMLERLRLDRAAEGS